MQEDKADWLIYVTDAGQASHFQLVYASARKAGILPKDAKQPPRVDHVGFGLVLSADRKRIATRSAKKVGPVAGLAYCISLVASWGPILESNLESCIPLAVQLIACRDA